MPQIYAYQREAVDFLVQRKRAILADDIGLGKTIEALVALKELDAKRIIIFCQKSLLSNWKREIQTWDMQRYVLVCDGTIKERVSKISRMKEGILLINTESLRYLEIQDAIYNAPFDSVVFDEAHRLCDRRSAQSKGAAKISRKNINLFLLTGTPILNRISDLWHLLHLVDPISYRAYWRWIKENAEVVVNPWLGFTTIGKTAKDPERLNQEIQYMFLRRTREEVLELPEIQFIDLWLDMGKEQKKLYDQMERDMFISYFDQKVVAPIRLSQILRLKQIAVAPSILFDDEGYSPIGEVKIEAAVDIVNSTDKKVLIFSQFSRVAEKLKIALDKENIGNVLYIGETSVAQRVQREKEFKEDPECRVFLATDRCGGEGLNLTEASVVIFMDKNWTPAVINQCYGRSYRNGQKDKVVVYYLMTKGTVDEWIDSVLDEKMNASDQIMGLIEKRSQYYKY